MWNHDQIWSSKCFPGRIYGSTTQPFQSDRKLVISQFLGTSWEDMCGSEETWKTSKASRTSYGYWVEGCSEETKIKNDHEKHFHFIHISDGPMCERKYQKASTNGRMNPVQWLNGRNDGWWWINGKMNRRMYRQMYGCVDHWPEMDDQMNWQLERPTNGWSANVRIKGWAGTWRELNRLIASNWILS